MSCRSRLVTVVIVTSGILHPEPLEASDQLAFEAVEVGVATDADRGAALGLADLALDDAGFAAEDAAEEVGMDDHIGAAEELPSRRPRGSATSWCSEPQGQRSSSMVISCGWFGRCARPASGTRVHVAPGRGPSTAEERR